MELTLLVAGAVMITEAGTFHMLGESWRYDVTRLSLGKKTSRSEKFRYIVRRPRWFTSGGEKFKYRFRWDVAE